MQQYADNIVFAEIAKNISAYISDLPLTAFDKNELTVFIIEQTQEMVKEAVKLTSQEIMTSILSTLANREAH